MITSPTQGPTRRTVVAGAAWASPVIVAAAAAPALAASRCPSMPTGTAFTTVVAGSVSNAAATWSGGRLTYYTDASTTDAVVTMTAQIQVTAGTTYTMSFVVETQYAKCEGDPAAPTGKRTDMEITMDGERLLYLTTQNSAGSGAPAEATLQAPSCPQARFGPKVTYTATYTATTTGSVPFVYRFTMPASGIWNDDYRVTPSFVSCTP